MQATPPQPGAQGWVQMVPCPQCGQSIDPTKSVYNKQGELVCKACESADIIKEGYVRAARSISFGALGTSIVTFFFNPFLILSIAATVAAIQALLLIHRKEYREQLGGQYGSCLVAAIAALIIGGVWPGARILLGMLGLLL